MYASSCGDFLVFDLFKIQVCSVSVAQPITEDFKEGTSPPENIQKRICSSDGLSDLGLSDKTWRILTEPLDPGKTNVNF